jgi:hypothetical protein
MSSLASGFLFTVSILVLGLVTWIFFTTKTASARLFNHPGLVTAGR